MTFRLLHTSDWHLGQHFYGKSRKQEHQEFLAWLLVQIKEQQVDAVVVAGDIFDTGTPPSYAREMYFDFVVKVHQLNCQLVVLAGNHDSVAMLSESKAVLSELSCHVIPSVSNDISDQIITLNSSNGDKQAIICGVPFIRPRDILLSQSGQTTKDKQYALQQAIREHYQAIYQQAKEIANEQVPIIATGHLTTVGVTATESVRDIYIGTLEAFPASEFPNADYIALGHIHRSQKVAKTEHIRYSGSPIPLSFDEAKQDKKVLVTDFNGAKLSQVNELIIPCFQPLVMLKTNLTELEDEVSLLLDETELADNQKLWLDIEIDSAQYLSDLTTRIDRIVSGKPIEVLLVRRTKQNRQRMTGEKENTTLNELKLTDVFQTRLLEENWDSEEDKARKERVEQLFMQTAEQLALEQNSDEASESTL